VLIDRIELYRVAMPLLTPWHTPYSEDAVIESVLVKMTSGPAPDPERLARLTLEHTAILPGAR
jgi:hypothetical protein